MYVHAQTIHANHIQLQLLCLFDYDYTYDSTCSSDCIEQSEPAMQHRFSDQIECGYDNDLSVSDLPKADQWIRMTSPRLLVPIACHVAMIAV